MKKIKNYYFDAFIELIEYSKKAADYLDHVVNNLNSGSSKKQKDEIHIIEHQADIAKHKIQEKLVKEFLPPINRDDILSIIREIDDVTDSIEEVVLRLYMYNVKEIPKSISQYTEIISLCCEALKQLAIEFHLLKRSKKIGILIEKVLEYERDCDVLYSESLRDLFVNEKDATKLLIWSDLYNRLENCCDACGEASLAFETAYMNNL